MCFAIMACDIHFHDMCRETTIHVVVFSMYITADRSAHRNEFGSRSYRKKPAFWNNDGKYFIQCQSRLAFKNAFFCIEGQDLIVLQGADCFCGQGGISVTTAVAPCNKAVLTAYISC